MTRASRWFRGFEIALWVVGLSLLGVALGATLTRWNYQAQQERALFERAPAVSVETQQRAAALAPERQPGPTTDDPSEAAARAVDRTDHADREVVAAPRRIKQRVNADPAALGLIEIPRLGVSAVVSEGADEMTLTRAVGLVPGSAHPGEPGNMVMAGHRDTFFRPLRKIRLNDRIRVLVPPHTYEYRVQSLRVVGPEETSVLDSKGVEELTLVTCYPFRFVGPAPERFIVSALRVN